RVRRGVDGPAAARQLRPAEHVRPRGGDGALALYLLQQVPDQRARSPPRLLRGVALLEPRRDDPRADELLRGRRLGDEAGLKAHPGNPGASIATIRARFKIPWFAIQVSAC